MMLANVCALVGRLCLAAIFLVSAFGKVQNFDMATRYMSSHGIIWTGPLCVAAILVEIAGGLSLLLGVRVHWGAAALIAFLIPTTLIFHMGPDQRIQMLKNLAIMGGLLQVAAFGSGDIGLDRRISA